MDEDSHHNSVDNLVRSPKHIGATLADKYPAPPTYSYSHQSVSQSESTMINHLHHQQCSHSRIDAQELPAEPVDPSATNRYSELPGQTAAHRLSELPTGEAQAIELESPQVSPLPPQTEFASTTAEQPPQGLGLTGTGEHVKP